MAFDASSIGSASTVTLSDGRGGIDTLIGIEKVVLVGSLFGDTLTGSAGDDLIDDGDGGYVAGAGNDVIVAGDGDDTVFIGDGSDSILGGAGDDFACLSNFADVEGGNATLDGGAGTDTMEFQFNFVEGGVSFDASDLGSVLTQGASANRLDRLFAFEALIVRGSDDPDSLTGSKLNDLIFGGRGGDTLNGGVGADTLQGDEGSDTYTVDNAGDVLFESNHLPFETDSVNASVSWTLGADFENLTLTGGAAIDGTGNTLRNVIAGNNAANTLNGGGGADTVDGGLGNDTYRVDNVGDVVTETSALATEIDLVNANLSWTLGANLENLTLTGGNAIDGTGNSLANRIMGNAADNVLSGGSGVDTLIGGLGSDTYVVINMADVVTESGTDAAAVDRVRSSVTWKLGDNLEELTLTGSNAINGTGNTAANTMVGNSGINILTGGAGADTLSGAGAADVFVINSRSTSDLITDFVRNTDDLRINQGAIPIGDGDTVIDGAHTLAGPGGFAASAELVVVMSNISGSLTAGRAAAAIGSANSAYAVGDTRLFVVDNGVDSALYLFTAANANALVTAGELQLLATLRGTASVAVTDIVFGP